MKVTQSCPTRDWIQVSHVAGGFFTIWGIREAHKYGSQFSHPPLSQIKNWLPERLSDLSHIIQRIWVSQIVFVPSYTLLLNTHFINQRWMCELLFIRAWMLETVWVRHSENVFLCPRLSRLRRTAWWFLGQFSRDGDHEVLYHCFWTLGV